MFTLLVTTAGIGHLLIVLQLVMDKFIQRLGPKTWRTLLGRIRLEADCYRFQPYYLADLSPQCVDGVLKDSRLSSFWSTQEVHCAQSTGFSVKLQDLNVSHLLYKCKFSTKMFK